MSYVKSLSMCVALALFCSISVAQDGTSCPASCKECPSASAVATTAKKDETHHCSGCAVAAAMKNLPAMTYKVGEEATCCSESAQALAKKHNKPMHFVVGEKTYESKEKAYTALVESTEKFVNDFITPKKCEKKRQDFDRRCQLRLPNGCWQEN